MKNYSIFSLRETKWSILAHPIETRRIFTSFNTDISAGNDVAVQIVKYCYSKAIFWKAIYCKRRALKAINETYFSTLQTWFAAHSFSQSAICP